MANMDLTPKPGGNGPNCAKESPTPKTADPRVNELEREVARLRGELHELQRKYEIEHELLETRIRRDLPETEEEFLRLAREGPEFKQLLRDLFQAFGLEERPWRPLSPSE